jgi:uncharacterized protein with PIN domain
MFARLGRWLRVAGYDTRIALGGETDRALVLTAQSEGRLLLTRDREILTIRGAPAATLVLPHDDVDACAAELGRRLGLDWRHDPFSRCVVCNVPLRSAGPELGARFVEASLDGRCAVNACPSCGRLYWEGDHVRRMRARLDRWAAGTGESGFGGLGG